MRSTRKLSSADELMIWTLLAVFAVLGPVGLSKALLAASGPPDTYTIRQMVEQQFAKDYPDMEGAKLSNAVTAVAMKCGDEPDGAVEAVTDLLGMASGLGSSSDEVYAVAEHMGCD